MFLISRVFERPKEFSVHKDDSHPDITETGPHHTGVSNEYHCPKCDDTIRVKHIVWFSKHIQYCRVDNEIANAIVGPDEADSDLENDDGVKRRYGNKRTETTEMMTGARDTEERLRITGDGGMGRRRYGACRCVGAQLFSIPMSMVGCAPAILRGTYDWGGWSESRMQEYWGACSLRRRRIGLAEPDCYR